MTELLSLKNRLVRILLEQKEDTRTQAVLEEVNWHLVTRCKKEISIGDLKQIEKLAIGHHDYSNKFALYCAERILYGKVMSK